MRRRLAPPSSPWRAVAAIVLHPVEQDPDGASAERSSVPDRERERAA